MRLFGSGEPAPLVLVTDDEEAVRYLWRTTLEDAGFGVIEASGAEHALAQFQAGAPDVVVMDIGMPGMDGLTACRRLREMPGGEDASILIMSAHDADETLQRVYDAGASDFMSKRASDWNLLPHRVRFLARATARMRALRAASKA